MIVNVVCNIAIAIFQPISSGQNKKDTDRVIIPTFGRFGFLVEQKKTAKIAILQAAHCKCIAHFNLIQRSGVAQSCIQMQASHTYQSLTWYLKDWLKPSEKQHVKGKRKIKIIIIIIIRQFVRCRNMSVKSLQRRRKYPGWQSLDKKGLTYFFEETIVIHLIFLQKFFNWWQSFYLMCGLVAEWLGRWTCNQ